MDEEPTPMPDIRTRQRDIRHREMSGYSLKGSAGAPLHPSDREDRLWDEFFAATGDVYYQSEIMLRITALWKRHEREGRR